MTQQTASRGAIAQASAFIVTHIIPWDGDQDCSKLTTIENESRALRRASPSREDRSNPAKNTFDTLWDHYRGAFCRPPRFFGQQENST
jgi:hypothetical protein